MPDVSIIIPCYNAARFLREAIDSALAQAVDGLEVEVIVVDDGSTDGSRPILESYGDRVVAIHQANAGASSARNIGWRAARALYFKFLDADDRLLPSALLRQYRQQQALEAEHPQAITFTDGRIIGASGSVSSESYYPATPRNRFFSAAELVQRAPITPMPLFPRAAMEAVGGFDPAVRSADEYDLEVRLQFSGWSFYILDFPGYDYRLYTHADRLSQQRLSPAAFAARFNNYSSHLQLAAPSLSKDDSGALAAAFASIFWSTGRYALRCEEREAAQRFFEKARQLSDSVPFGNRIYRYLCRLLGPERSESLLAGLRRRRGRGH
jgi:glycosyltransferase involved in cell wall biosynthesis